MASLDTGNTPQGYSGASAIAMVQALTNEPTLPTQAQVLLFLNKGVEEVVRQVGGIRLWAGYTTVNNQTNVLFNDDVMDIISANFSMGSASYSNLTATTTPGSASPLAQGALVYPIDLLEQKAFMDAAAGFPAVGFGPPQAGFIYQDQGASPNNPLPAPLIPQLSEVSGTSTGVEVYVVITYLNANGETTVSPTANYTPTSTAYQTVVASPQSWSNATTYNVYASTSSSGPFYLQSTTANGGPVTIGNTFTLPGTLLATGTTPPTTNTAIGSGTGGALAMQLYPAAMLGQINIYYRARPQLWADTTSNSWTNLDTMAQEAVVLFAVGRVLATRQRMDEWKSIWEPMYKGTIEDLKEAMNRRTTPKSGQVRDITNRSFPSSPFWLR
jgi:hypothetical protein